ncbi:MAG: RidA family protein [Pseudomonadota bacterium]
MTKITKVKTGSKYEEIGSYSRVVAVDNWIYVSNTAGRNPETAEMPEDPIEQTKQVLANIESALAKVDATLADVVRSRVFITNPDNVSAVMSLIGASFKGVDPALTVTCPPLGGDVYEVEIEVTAYRAASQAEIELIGP